MQLQPPIITADEQFKDFIAFLNDVSAEGSVTVARAEAKRLQRYFNALSEILQHPDNTAGARATIETGSLSRLFNVIAKRTNSVILSEMAIVPQRVLLDVARYFSSKRARVFSGGSVYDRRAFTLAFIQMFNDKKGNVSLPVLAFNDDCMKAVAPFAPQGMLCAFQTVMNAGNHDMLHHYSNRVLNTDIAKLRKNADGSFIDGGNQLIALNKACFPGGDAYEKSYESFLMLLHARVRKALKGGDKPLHRAGEVFFDELARIGQEIAKKDKVLAHETVDYFGSVLCFAMMRYLPFDHPLIERAIERLQQADPDPSRIEAARDKIVETVREYATQDFVDVIGAYGIKDALQGKDYRSLKKLQLLSISPWIPRLMGAASYNFRLEEAQMRAPGVARTMFMAAGWDSGFCPVDGVQHSKQPNGDVIERSFRNGELHAEGAPALRLKRADGSLLEKWYDKGNFVRETDTARKKRSFWSFSRK